MPEGDLLMVNGFRSGQSWVVNFVDPLNPTIEATFEGAGPYTSPHSFERLPNGNRVVLTGGGEALWGMVVLLEIEPGTGRLTVVEGFGEQGDLGVSMRGESWPHGDTSWAIPHGTVFSR